MNVRRNQKGFTLIELMIVIAILAILMAIAIPAYQDYTIRSQVSEGMNLAGGARTAVAEYWTNYGEWPDNNETAGLAEPDQIVGNYVSSVTVQEDGLIVVAFNQPDSHTNIRTETLGLQGQDGGTTAGSVEWDCRAGTVSETTILPKYLPARCRPGAGGGGGN